METLPNEQLLCYFMISKLYLLKTKVMDINIKSNSRPEWSLVLGRCPQQFFLTIYLTKPSVNILWAQGLLRSEVFIIDFCSKKPPFICPLDASFNV